MDSSGLGFRGTVLAGLVVAAVVGIVTWLLGFLPQAWRGIVVVAHWLWRVLAYSVPVPVVVLVIIAGFGLYAWRKLATSARVQPAESVSFDDPSANDAVALSANETLVVCLLARADGEWMRLESIASKLNLPNLLVEQALERLLARGLIRHQNHVLEGPLFRLSSTGRDLAIDENFIPDRRGRA